MQYEEMKEKLDEYNWDDGFGFPKKIVVDSNCDLALALEVFYLADGDGFLYDYPDEPEGNATWKKFVKKLMQDILTGKYSVTDRHFEIPLSKVQRYKLSKLNVPEIFLKDL